MLTSATTASSDPTGRTRGRSACGIAKASGTKAISPSVSGCCARCVGSMGCTLHPRYGRTTRGLGRTPTGPLPDALVHAEIPYDGKSKAEKKSVDWIVVFDDLVLLVEAKSARLRAAARVGNETTQDAITKTASHALEQTYRTRQAIVDRVPHSPTSPAAAPSRSGGHARPVAHHQLQLRRRLLLLARGSLAHRDRPTLAGIRDTPDDHRRQRDEYVGPRNLAAQIPGGRRRHPDPRRRVAALLIQPGNA